MKMTIVVILWALVMIAAFWCLFKGGRAGGGCGGCCGGGCRAPERDPDEDKCCGGDDKCCGGDDKHCACEKEPAEESGGERK